ncbi:hypothetical protein [Desulfobacter latus]|uniref:Uncharacterized protein n=1 Tax=Desulfobacter latus TaxID=2292 RepID=A0A850T786_9BACT|nr:hypothetical protein [Desulfobacter latus]NWH06961.1 hypothetical protein [Desulfobacter latus]
MPVSFDSSFQEAKQFHKGARKGFGLSTILVERLREILGSSANALQLLGSQENFILPEKEF